MTVVRAGARFRRGRRAGALCAVAGALLLAATLVGVDPAATAAEPSRPAGSAAGPAAGPPATTTPALSAADVLAGLGLGAPEPVEATPTGAAVAVTPALLGDLRPGPGGVLTQPYSDCTNTTGVPYATGLPPLPCYLYPGQQLGKSTSAYTDNGAYFDPITQQARKAGLLLDLDPSVGRILTNLCNVTIRPCTPDFPVPPVLDPALSGAYFVTTGYVFLQSPLGDQPQFGTVTRKVTHPLAFGSIPGTATLTVSQQFTDGVATPLRLVWPSFTTLFPRGTVLPGYERYGANPYDGAQLALDLSITGPVTVSVSDVAIDGVPLDVGDSCHTDTTLSLYARGGWLGPTAVSGQPGEYQPFNPPGYVHASVDVPAFTGCVTGSGEDLSALLTGLVSGPGNQLDITQQTMFGAFGCLLGPTPNCGNKHPATVDPRCLADPQACTDGVVDDRRPAGG